MATARSEDIRLTYNWVSKTIVGLAVVAAIGLGTFAFVNTTSESSTAEKAVQQQPVVAVADLTAAGEEEFKGSFGENCNLEAVPVVALSSSESGWEVVSLPLGSCETARVSISEDEATLESSEEVEIELPELE